MGFLDVDPIKALVLERDRQRRDLGADHGRDDADRPVEIADGAIHDQRPTSRVRLGRDGVMAAAVAFMFATQLLAAPRGRSAPRAISCGRRARAGVEFSPTCRSKPEVEAGVSTRSSSSRCWCWRCRRCPNSSSRCCCRVLDEPPSVLEPVLRRRCPCRWTRSSRARAARRARAAMPPGVVVEVEPAVGPDGRAAVAGEPEAPPWPPVLVPALVPEPVRPCPFAPARSRRRSQGRCGHDGEEPGSLSHAFLLVASCHCHADRPDAEGAREMFGNPCAAPLGTALTAVSANPYTRSCAAGSRAGAAPLAAASDRSVDTMNAPLPEAVRKALESVTLDDKYTLESGRAFMSGVQALVRLPMLQRKRDAIVRPQHRRLHQRLPRLAARRLRPGAVGGEEAPRGAEHRLPARRQRGARGDRRVGLAAARPLSADRRSSTACSASGTARARASTAAPTSSSTPTWPAPRSTAA